MSQISEIIEPLSSILIDKCQFILTDPEKIVTIPSTYLHRKQLSTANPSVGNNKITSSILAQLSDNIP